MGGKSRPLFHLKNEERYIVDWMLLGLLAIARLRVDRIKRDLCNGYGRAIFTCVDSLEIIHLQRFTLLDHESSLLHLTIFLVSSGSVV